MLIESATFQNFCQYRRFSTDFSPYLNLIHGSNGAGKTNLFRGILMLLTGDAGGSCTKLENINQLSSKDEPSLLQGVFVHKGRRYEVQRGLRRSGNFLLIDGVKRSESTTEISRILYDHFETSEHILQNYVMVKQGKTAAWIEMSDAQRAQDWASLYGLDRAASIHRELGEALRDLVVAEPVGNETELANAVQEQLALFADYEAQLLTYADVPDDLNAYTKPRTELIAQYMRWLTLQGDVKRRETEVGTAELKNTAEATRLRAVYDELTALGPILQEIGQAAAQAQTAIVNLTAYRQYCSAEAAIKTSVLSLVSRFRNRPTLQAKKPSTQSVDTLQATCGHLTSELARLKQSITATEGYLARGICPTCRQGLPNLEEQRAALAQTKQDYAEKQQQLAECQRLLPELRSYAQAVLAWKQQRSPLKLAVRQVQQQQDRLLVVEDPGVVDEAQLQETLRTYTTLSGDYTASLAKYNTDKAVYDEAVRSQAVALASYTALANELAELSKTCSPDKTTQAQQEIESAQRRYQERAEVRSSLAVARTNLANAEAALKRFHGEQAKYAKVQNARNVLIPVRMAFHHEEAPKKVSQTYMSLMQEKMNGTLDMFQAPFRTYPNESMGFNCEFLDGRLMPDKRLSGGERGVLAIAKLMATHTIFVGPLGMLIMDEPTEGMDEHNLGCLPSALERLRSEAKATGLQVLFVTHMAQLGYLFDKIIEIGKA